MSPSSLLHLIHYINILLYSIKEDAKVVFYHVSNSEYLTRLQKTPRPLCCIVDKRITNVDFFFFQLQLTEDETVFQEFWF